MPQVEVDLESVIATKATLSPNIPFAVTQQTDDCINPDEGDDIVTLNLEFINTPPAMSSSFPPFETSGGSPQVEDIEDAFVGTDYFCI